MKIFQSSDFLKLKEVRVFANVLIPNPWDQTQEIDNAPSTQNAFHKPEGFSSRWSSPSYTNTHIGY